MGGSDPFALELEALLSKPHHSGELSPERFGATDLLRIESRLARIDLLQELRDAVVELRLSLGGIRADSNVTTAARLRARARIAGPVKVSP